MAKKIVWTMKAISDRVKIYKFWESNNSSTTYSDKLETIFNDNARLIAEFPEIGMRTDIKDVFVKIIKDYKLYYFNQPDCIYILRIWDSRQNPEDLKM